MTIGAQRDRANIDDLHQRSAELRLLILETHRRAGVGHLGSSLSIVEILVVLFNRFVTISSGSGPNGDRVILSKGHAALGLYCQLMLSGVIEQEALDGFGGNGVSLEPHPNERLMPSVGASSGSLGQGLSIALGLAMGSRLRGRNDRSFVIIGDGETNEGQIWEAAQCAAHLGLGNLIAIVDQNGMQQDGPMADIQPMADIEGLWGRMGWITESCDGHKPLAIEACLANLLSSRADKPKLLVARTVKGRGVPFLENQTESHYPAPLTAEELSLIRYATLAEQVNRNE